MIDEGYIKFDIRWTKTPPLTHPQIDTLNRWRSRLMDARLIGHYDELGIGYGNLSARVGDGDHFIISATQTGHIAVAGPEHFALVTEVDIAKSSVSCRGPLRASSESMTHAALYALDPAIRSVVHAHDAKLWSEVLNTIPTTGPEIAYGTPEMAQDFARLCEDSGFLGVGIAAMAGHDAGLVAIGSSVEQASRRILDISDAAHGRRRPGAQLPGSVATTIGSSRKR